MISFDDLLSAPKKRSFLHEIEGVGVFELYELNGAEALERLAEAKEIDKLGAAGADKFQEHVYVWAGRLLKGKKPTKDDIKKLVVNLTPSIAYSIYTASVTSAPTKEEIEKN